MAVMKFKKTSPRAEMPSMKRMNLVYPLFSKTSLHYLAIAITATSFVATGCKKAVTRSSTGSSAAQQGVSADSQGNGSGGVNDNPNPGNCGNGQGQGNSACSGQPGGTGTTGTTGT